MDSQDVERKPSGKKRKRPGFGLIDDEAREGEDSDDEKVKKAKESDDEEDDEEEEDKYIEDDFLIGDTLSIEDEAVSDASDEKKPQSRALVKLKKKKGTMMLDAEDLAIVQESRKEYSPGKNVSKKKSMGGGASDYRDLDEDDPEVELDANDANLENSKSRNLMNREDDEESLGNFIVSDEEGDDRDGEVSDERKVRQAERKLAKAKVHQRSAGRDGGPTFDQIQEAIDIFGEAYDEFGDEEAEEAYQEGSDAEVDRPFVDGELEGDRALERKKEKELRSINRLRSKFERSQLVSSFCTENDDKLRALDLPERTLSLLGQRVAPGEEERAREVKWLSALLADRMVVDQKLEEARLASLQSRQAAMAARSSRRSIPTPSFLLRRGAGPFNKELLLQNLMGPVENVLKFMQVYCHCLFCF